MEFFDKIGNIIITRFELLIIEFMIINSELKKKLMLLFSHGYSIFI